MEGFVGGKKSKQKIDTFKKKNFRKLAFGRDMNKNSFPGKVARVNCVNCVNVAVLSKSGHQQQREGHTAFKSTEVRDFGVGQTQSRLV